MSYFTVLLDSHLWLSRLCVLLFGSLDSVTNKTPTHTYTPTGVNNGTCIFINITYKEGLYINTQNPDLNSWNSHGKTSTLIGSNQIFSTTNRIDKWI